MVPGKQRDLWSRYNRYFNRNATSQRMAVAAFARAIRLHPKYDRAALAAIFLF